jgi:hypothetical protein
MLTGLSRWKCHNHSQSRGTTKGPFTTAAQCSKGKPTSFVPSTIKKSSMSKYKQHWNINWLTVLGKAICNLLFMWNFQDKTKTLPNNTFNWTSQKFVSENSVYARTLQSNHTQIQLSSTHIKVVLGIQLTYWFYLLLNMK